MMIKICIGDFVEFRLLLGKAKQTNAVFRLLNTGGAHANGADLICAKFPDFKQGPLPSQYLQQGSGIVCR
ncbi:MAG: hypothetical protein IKJ16_07635, partial [Agathobacter sp.]|nr:hypothetical protein [Agathobacter sp.]